MATASGVYLQTIADMIGNVYAFDYDADAINGALVKTAITTDFNDTTPIFGDVSTQPTNQPADSGDYTSGGSALTSKSLTIGTRATGVLDVVGTLGAWTGATLSAEGLVIFNDTIASPVDPLLCQIDFGGTVASTAGTYTVTLDANGYIQMDLVP